MTTQHTPGPWINWRDASKNARMVLISDAILDALAYATVSGPDPRANHANARLIAAAPDLLDALEYARDRLETCNYEGDEDEALERINTAIAKAKGE